MFFSFIDYLFVRLGDGNFGTNIGSIGRSSYWMFSYFRLGTYFYPEIRYKV